MEASSDFAGLFNALKERNGAMHSNPVEPISKHMEAATNFVIDYHSNSTQFKPGDKIVWKPGMKNRKNPEYNEPIIVLDVFPTQRTDDEKGSHYGCEPLDMRCIIMLDTEDNEPLPYGLDSKRFKLYQG